MSRGLKSRQIHAKSRLVQALRKRLLKVVPEPESNILIPSQEIQDLALHLPVTYP